jgi:hypothetical protein
MNKRIQQLVEQATTRIQPTATSGEGWIFDKEKFAELIISECVGICEHEWNGDADTFAASEAYNECADAIKQHFGVEE